jgi:hypothetical protein
VTVSASLLSALRICEAATLVDVFSKACNVVVSKMGPDCDVLELLRLQVLSPRRHSAGSRRCECGDKASEWQ